MKYIAYYIKEPVVVESSKLKGKGGILLKRIEIGISIEPKPFSDESYKYFNSLKDISVIEDDPNFLLLHVNLI